MAEVELQQFGSYNSIELLGSSSASTFYSGQSQKNRKKSVLIKRLNMPFTSNEEKEAFFHHARKLKKLVNRNIIKVEDVGFVDDHGYLVMEYSTGKPLDRIVPAGKQIGLDEVRRYLSPLANALHYAHVNSVLHANLHPSILLTNEKDIILLTEFALTQPGSSLILDDEAFAIPYRAPEHLLGQPCAASDQYSLAVMAYEWLCGQRPYDAVDADLLLEQQKHAPTPPSNLNSAISPAVEKVLLRALSYDPAERFPHVLSFGNNYLGALLGFQVPEELRTARPLVPGSVISTPVNNKVRPLIVAEHVPEMKVAQPEPLPEQLASMSPTPHIQTQVPPTPHLEGDLDSTDLLEKQQETVPLSQIKVVKEETPAMVQPQQVRPPIPKVSPNSRLLAIIEDDLRQGGVLSRSLPGYEERPAQVEMASVVARSLTQNVPAIIEASTGTGKSLAYLVPVVRSGKVAIVSTANKALQEQLFFKDIPFVQKYIKHFEAALVKGVNNYVCIERMETERVGMQFYAKNAEFKRLYQMTQDPESTFLGDFETLGFQLPADIRTRIHADTDQCAWTKCSFYSECYVRQMRERAQQAQVIVVNHTLLLLDAVFDGFLLPERDVIILDEAHHLEEEATRSFTITISPAQIQTLLAQRMLKDHSQVSLQDEVAQAANLTWTHLELVADPGFKGRTNLNTPLEEGLRLANRLFDLADSLRKQRPKDLPDKESQLYDKLLKRTQNLAEGVRTVFSVAQPSKYVYYVDRVEGPRGSTPLQASAAPLDITNWLKERLFNKCNVICTSATLATVSPNPVRPEEKGPNFSYFRRRVGLDIQERPEIIERILPLTFDYESNALLYLPRDLPEPMYGAGSDEYMKAIAREMYRLVKLSRGRAFLLFSSKRMLDRAYELMSPHLPYPLLKQGDMTRIELTRRFREEEGSVLFGLKSFWEGVDIAGDALSLVVIDKLPFDPPDDPVHEARVNMMKANNENWFGTYVLPQAVLRLKQGLGRLLRSRDDRGVMAILDTRLHKKGYGKMVLNALPPARRTSSIRDVEQFFKEDAE